MNDEPITNTPPEEGTTTQTPEITSEDEDLEGTDLMEDDESSDSEESSDEESE